MQITVSLVDDYGKIVGVITLLFINSEASSIVYDLKFVGPLEFELVAPMPEQLKTTTMHFYVPPDTSGKCIVVVPVCSGVGATKLKFWVLRS